MTDHDDMQMIELFDNAVQPLPDSGFSSAVMRRLDSHERAGRVLDLTQGGAVLGLAAMLVFVLKDHLRTWAANGPDLLAQHPWWLAGLLAVLSLLPASRLDHARPSA